MAREEVINYLMNISYQLGTTSIEYLSEKDGEKMREAIKALEQEPCEDAISRQAVLDKEVYTETSDGWTGWTVDVNDIKELPPVTPAEKVGHWIEKDGNWYCSECDCLAEEWLEKPTYKYCSECGAKMG